MTFQTDRRLRVDMKTSIELVIAAPVDQVSDGPIPLVALEGQGGITLWMQNDRKGLAFGEDGLGHGRFSPVDLSSGDYQHIVLVINGTSTTPETSFSTRASRTRNRRYISPSRRSFST